MSGEDSMRLVCATANPDKVREIRAVLGDGIELVPRPVEVPDVLEDAPTLEGNARLKATAICSATGLPAIADDTGLEVDALGGAPGVFSARYAGSGATYLDNQRKLIADMEGRTDRGAAFRTVALVRWPDGTELVAEGVCRGVITEAPRGEGGFGYDPVFEPLESDGATFAEMSAEAKNAISHRGRAFRALANALRSP
jgi:XTP/dITP diphosphohydrolase